MSVNITLDQAGGTGGFRENPVQELKETVGRYGFPAILTLVVIGSILAAIFVHSMLFIITIIAASLLVKEVNDLQHSGSHNLEQGERRSLNKRPSSNY